MARKVLYGDIVPYDIPASLQSLRGPKSGFIELPLAVHWGPQRSFDLSKPYDVIGAYQAIVREGTVEVQEALLNSDLLRQVWNDLALPPRCRDLWERRFPELSG